MGADWPTWALQGLTAFLLAVIWKQLQENTKELTAIRLELAKDYVTKSDFDKFKSELKPFRDWVHDKKGAEGAIEKLAKLRKDDADR